MNPSESPHNTSRPEWESELQARLKADEVAPPECVWSELCNRLDEQKSAKRVIFLWEDKRFLQAANLILLILLFSLGGAWWITSNNQEPSTVTIAQESAKPTQDGKKIPPPAEHADLPTPNSLTNPTERFISADYPAGIATEMTIPTTTAVPAFLPEARQLTTVPTQPVTLTYLPATSNINVPTLIAIQEDDLPRYVKWIENNEPKIKRWSMGGSVGTGAFRNQVNTTRDVSFTSIKESFSPNGGMTFRKERDTVTIAEQTDMNPSWAYQVGVLFNYALTKRWSLQSGFQYTMQKTSRSGEYVLRDIEKGDRLAPTTIPYNDTTAFQLEQYNYRMPQTLHYVGLPVRIAFRLGNEKWGFTTATGVQLNYLASAPIPNALEEQRFGFPTVFNPWHVSGLLGFGVEYRMNKDYAVVLEPNLRVSLTSITRKEVETNYPHSLGIAFTFVRNL
jgi:hypothetical protein